MAKRVKHDKSGDGKAKTQAAGLDHDEFRRLLAEADRQSGLASEYAGSAGKVIRDGIDRLSLNRKAVQMTRSLNKLDPAKRNEAIRCLHEYIEAAGFYDQMDAFSDAVDYLAQLVDRLKSRIPNRETDGTVAAILN